MTRAVFHLLAIAVALHGLALDASAGGGPFVPSANARVDRPGEGDGMSILSAAEPPATALIAGGTFSATASATFTRLGAGTENFVLGNPINARASMQDILTIDAPGAPAGTTRLELHWRLVGEITTAQGTAARARFQSRYEPSGVAFPSLSAGDLMLSAENPGPVDQVVTFVYDNVPVGSAWSMTTTLEVNGSGSVSVVDFADTAALFGADFFVDGQRRDATVTGQSGALYSIPEPASLAVVALAGLAMVSQRQKRRD